MERDTGIEPASLAWKARVIATIRIPLYITTEINKADTRPPDAAGDRAGNKPLYYTRILTINF